LFRRSIFTPEYWSFLDETDIYRRDIIHGNENFHRDVRVVIGFNWYGKPVLVNYSKISGCPACVLAQKFKMP
jgi:hypothetical protein